MSVPLQPCEGNPNPSGGCWCYPANNPDQPRDERGRTPGLLNPALYDPERFRCFDCPNEKSVVGKERIGVEDYGHGVIDSTAVEIVEFAPAKRKAPPRKS